MLLLMRCIMYSQSKANSECWLPSMAINTFLPNVSAIFERVSVYDWKKKVINDTISTATAAHIRVLLPRMRDLLKDLKINIDYSTPLCIEKRAKSSVYDQIPGHTINLWWCAFHCSSRVKTIVF